MPQTVSVPVELEPLFQQAQDFVGAYFDSLYRDPTHGTLAIGGQRYVLVRAASMSVEFYETITRLYGDQGEHEARAVARNLLYDLAQAIGGADARAFHRELSVTDPVERLSMGPVHFAHAGWARVAIHPESNPVDNPDFLLLYDHPYSFEADAWLTASKSVDFPVCMMNAGYSSGWCSESFGLPLVAVEICCKAMGDDQCRFVMATPERIPTAIATYVQDHPALARPTSTYEIPGFFRRKQAEDDLRERETQYRSIFEGVSDAILIIGPGGYIAAVNTAAERLYGWTRDQLVGRHALEVTAPASRGMLTDLRNFPAAGVNGEALGLTSDGRIFEVEFHAAPLSYRHQPHALIIVSDISERKRLDAERLRLQEQLVRQNTRLREELSWAHTVQQSLLPQRPPWRSERLQVASRSLPAGVVSRDFYVYADLGNDRLLVALGDVQGKGVAAALVMALVVSAIEDQARLTGEPMPFLHAIQARLAPRLHACEMFVALQVVVVELARRIVGVANAGSTLR